MTRRADIVGRRDELLALRSFLDGMTENAAALLLDGDAGIGTTALWQEGIHLARERGFRVIASRSAYSEIRIAFATIGDLFAPVLGDELGELVPVQRRALETALLMRAPDGPPADARLLGTALLAIVKRLAEDRPLLVALDDTQWVDPTSAEVLTFVLRRLEPEAVGILATVRGHPVSAPLELDRGSARFRRLSVEPLSVGALHRLLWGRLGLTLSRPLLLRVHETTGGNPFYALELGRALADGTLELDGEITLPDSLSAVVSRRLAALPATVRETLVAVAALAAPSVTVLEPLGGTVVADIDLAHARGVVDLDGDAIRFTHPLLAPACYEAMPLHRRRRVHRRLSELDVGLEERARHLAVARAGPDEEVATVLDAAAAHAHARGAAQAAADLARRAVAATPPAAGARLERRRVTAADHCMYAGDMTAATALLEDAVGSAKPGPVRADALYELANATAMTHGFRAAEPYYLRAVDEPDVRPARKIEVLCELAWNRMAEGDNATGERHAQTALSLAEESADPAGLGNSLATLAEVLFSRTGCVRQDLLDRAIEVEPRGDDGAPTRAQFTLGRLLTRSDRFDEARAAWQAMIASATERSDPHVLAYRFFLAWTEIGAGAWDAAVRMCDEGTEIARQNEREMSQAIFRMAKAEVAALRGEEATARAEIPELLEMAREGGYGGAVDRLSRGLALIELSCGDAAAGWAALAPLYAAGREIDEHLAQATGSSAVEVLVATGDVDAAERLLESLEAYATSAETSVPSLAARCRGVVQAARGDLAGAIVALEGAAEAPSPPRQANPFERARTLLALGTVHRQARHKRAAHESLSRALEIFDELGARLWAEKTRGELRRIGGRIPSRGALSETERQIVDLVVSGRKNREVATVLSLSPNTVAWNLSKVYRKLGVSSRTELAAHVAGSPQQ